MAPSEKCVWVSAVGAACSLGDAQTACAGARAGITRIEELQCLNFGDRTEFGREQVEGIPSVFGHVAAGMHDGFSRSARSVRLCEFAMKDLLRRHSPSAKSMARCGFHLNLSDCHLQDHFADRFPETTGDEDAAPSEDFQRETVDLIPRLLHRCEIAIPESNQRRFYAGSAGIVAAIELARQRLACGEIEGCIVGGVDSRVEPRPLQAAATFHQLKTNDNPCGYIPGEAAAFFLVQRRRDDRSNSSGCLSIIACAEAEDSRDLLDDDPPVGDGLTAAIDRVLSRVPETLGLLGYVIGDLNGTERKAIDWGHALIRLRGKYGARLGSLPVWIPALHFGETGAATGALAICMATRAFARGYAPGDAALIWLASEGGRRAAIAVKRS